jgi:5,10-methylene-tetrahydrofolate dehydrogenase/methenyl tetrahydrofolate cyclohydrolase
MASVIAVLPPVVVNVGINRNAEGNLVGDVDFANMKEVVGSAVFQRFLYVDD